MSDSTKIAGSRIDSTTLRRGKVERASQESAVVKTLPIAPRNKPLKQALLCCPVDADAAVLEAQLRRMGLHVAQQWPLPEAISPAADTLLLLSVNLESQAHVSRLAGAHTGPVLGLVEGAEARLLERLGSLGLHGVLLRPYRYAALQAQLSIALATLAYQARLQDKVQHLEGQLRARRLIEHATRVLVVIHEIAPHEAYDRLRRLAMSQRLTLVEAAQALLGQAAAVSDNAGMAGVADNENACPSTREGQAKPLA